MFGIQKMLLMPPDYFRYFSMNDESKAWGLAVTAAGFTHVKPGIPYPPTRHPEDRDFCWETGRTLSGLQVVSIQAGKGWFESQVTGRKRMLAGSAFLVIPGVWHRYRPDASTGWTESWVEMKGLVIDRLIEGGVISVRRQVMERAASTSLDEALNALHVRVRQSPDSFDARITATAFEILAAWTTVDRRPHHANSTIRKIIDAEHYLSSHHREPIDMRRFAEGLGIAYSHFRKLFRDHTGYAPWAYVRQIRLVRGRRLLSQTDFTLQEIADELGFGSAFHFSTAFKAAFGLAPNLWRRKHASMRKKRPTKYCR